MWDRLIHIANEHFGKISISLASLIVLVKFILKLFSNRTHKKRMARLEKLYNDNSNFKFPFGAEGIQDYINRLLTPNKPQGSIRFFRSQKIFLNNGSKVVLNNVEIPQGYGTYEIINDKKIQLNIYDEKSKKYSYAYIYKANNVNYDKYQSKEIFEKIINWKNK
jgi:hypothetical protein